MSEAPAPDGLVPEHVLGPAAMAVQWKNHVPAGSSAVTVP